MQDCHFHFFVPIDGAAKLYKKLGQSKAFTIIMPCLSVSWLLKAAMTKPCHFQSDLCSSASSCPKMLCSMALLALKFNFEFFFPVFLISVLNEQLHNCFDDHKNILNTF